MTRFLCKLIGASESNVALGEPRDFHANDALEAAERFADVLFNEKKLRHVSFPIHVRVERITEDSRFYPELISSTLLLVDIEDVVRFSAHLDRDP